MLLSVRLFLEGHVSQGFTGADVLQTLVCQFVVPDVEILQMLHAPDVLQAASFEAVSIEDELLGLREGVAEHLDARVAELILTQDEFLDLPEPAQGQQIFIGQALLRQVDLENGFGHRGILDVDHRGSWRCFGFMQFGFEFVDGRLQLRIGIGEFFRLQQHCRVCLAAPVGIVFQLLVFLPEQLDLFLP